MDLVPIPSQTVGPFFHLGCTLPSSVGSLVKADTRGDRIHLTCRILDGNGVPVPDAMIEIWQADAAGRYNHPDDKVENSPTAFRGYGRLATDDQGSCTFTTIMPGQVPANDGAQQASHINVSVFARGVLARLATRIYFAQDPALANDFILSLVPAERRETLMAKRDSTQSNEWHFDIHLCGEQETVFFDV